MSKNSVPVRQRGISFLIILFGRHEERLIEPSGTVPIAQNKEVVQLLLPHPGTYKNEL